MGALSPTRLVGYQRLTPRCTTHINQNLCLANVPSENKGHTVRAQHQRGETKTTAQGRGNNTVNKEKQSQQSQTREKKHRPREAQQRESRSQSHTVQPHQPLRCQEQPTTFRSCLRESKLSLQALFHPWFRYKLLLVCTDGKQIDLQRCPKGFGLWLDADGVGSAAGGPIFSIGVSSPGNTQWGTCFQHPSLRGHEAVPRGECNRSLTLR